MARRGAKGGRGNTRSQSKKKAPAAEVAEVEVIEESGGLGIGEGILIMTFVILTAAALMVDYAIAQNYPGTEFPTIF
jgi:hypothetical protein